MLMTVITAENYLLARQHILQILHKTDGVELRFDYWKNIEIENIQKLRDEFALPMIFTLRKKSQGGLFIDDESVRLDMLLKLCECKPDYIDIEFDVPQKFFDRVKSLFPNINIICSYHDFEKTPGNLNDIFQQMRCHEVQIYKIATFAQTTLDALRLLVFLKRHPAFKIAALSIGEAGIITRIVGKVVGSCFTYAAYHQNNLAVPHQLTLDELRDVYHVHQLNQQTQLYALLGNPIDKSVGHILHNQSIRFLKINAVYIKINIPKEIFVEARDLLQQLPFAGFSVTMPLKEAVIPPQVINSITQDDSTWKGTNTDGRGTINAIKSLTTTLNQKKIIILGAGGTAKAIAETASQEGAEVFIFNRTFHTAELLAKTVGGNAFSLDTVSEIKKLNYDLLINTLPTEVPIEVKDFIPGTYAMDCVYQPVYTNFLQKASTAGCYIIPGFHLYIEQALLQLKIWFNPSAEELRSIKTNIMTSYFRAYTSTIPAEPVANNP